MPPGRFSTTTRRPPPIGQTACRCGQTRAPKPGHLCEVVNRRFPRRGLGILVDQTGELPMRSDFAGLVAGIAAERRPPTAKDNSDEALVAKIASGNRLAMQVLFARHHARIYRFVLRLLGSEALAEDVTSEVFLDVWRQAQRFEARSAVTTWLLAIARYKALTELRRRPEPPSDAGSMAASHPADDPGAPVASKHRGEILLNCLTRLPPRHPQIINLVYYHKKP